MIGFLSPSSYRAICKNWVKTITLLSESQIHVWPPLSCAFTVLNTFAHDKPLQEELFAGVKHKLIFIDGYEAINPSWNEFETQFFHFLDKQPHEPQDMDAYLSAHEDKLFGLFLVGFDSAIKHDNIDILKHIGSLLEKYPHLCVILLTEHNLPDTDTYLELIQRHMIVENIHYQSLLTEEDIHTCLKHIAQTWDFTYPEGMELMIAQNVGGHPLLLEEAARIVRDNPSISYQELFASESLIRKARMVFKLLNPQDQETIRAITQHQPIQPSEYLIKTGLVKEGKIGLQYWEYLHNDHPEAHMFVDTHPSHGTLSFEHTFTTIEKHVFDMMLGKINGITTREDVAQALWKDQWEDKYSDWAIDQTIHRLREKLIHHEAPFAIKTKKGEGFLLLNA